MPGNRSVPLTGTGPDGQIAAKRGHAVSRYTSVRIGWLALLAVANAAPAAVVLSYDAAGPGGSDGHWHNAQGQNRMNLRFDGNRKPTATAIHDPAAPGLRAAMTFDGFGATCDSLERFDRGMVRRDVSFEMWVRPDRLNGRQMLFETGGNVYGTALFLDGSDLVYIAQTGNAHQSVTTRAALSAEATERFLHVVAVTDFQNDSPGPVDIDLYVDGSLVGTNRYEGDFRRWAGRNGMGLGTKNRGMPGHDRQCGDLYGQIASFAVHDLGLSAGQVAGLYARTAASPAEAVPEPATLVLLGLGGALAAGRRRGYAS